MESHATESAVADAPAAPDRGGAGLTSPGGDAYVGPRPFPPDRQLYGRGRELLALTNRLLSERLVLLYSPSGAGKTSLIQARSGLRERMATEGFGLLPIIRVSQAADIAAREKVNRYLLSTLAALEPGRPVEELVGLVRPGRDGLASGFLDEHLKRLLGEEAPQPFLVFDQFEELLTLDPTDEAAKREFLRQVGVTLKNGDRWALFAMREDHVAALDPYLPLLPTRLAATFRLDLLGKAAAGEAIRGPAAEFGVTFEDGTVHRLLEELGKIQVQDPVSGKPGWKDGPYVEPLYLQIVCQRLWQERQEPARITPADLDRLAEGRGDDLRGVTAALARYYEDAVARVAGRFAGQGVSERAIRNWFARALISPEGLRLPVLLGSEQGYGLTPEVLHALADCYLIRSEQRLGSVWYELAHDRLIEPVRKSNTAWRAKLRPFQLQAELYKEAPPDKKRDLLVSGPVFQEGERLQHEAGPNFTTDDAAFLRACLEDRKQRRFKAWSIGISVAAILIGIVGGAILRFDAILGRQRQESKTEMIRQLDEQRQAQDRQTMEKLRGLIAAQQQYLSAQRSLADNPATSAVQGMEAVKLFVANGPGDIPTDLVESILPRALANQSMRTFGVRTSPLSEMTLDGESWLLTRGVDGTVSFWADPCAPNSPRKSARQIGIPVTRMAVTPDGQYVLVGHTDGRVCRWDLQTNPLTYIPLKYAAGKDAAGSESLGTAVTSLDVARSRSKPYAAIGYADGTVVLLDWQNWDIIRQWPAGEGRTIYNVLLTPNVRRLLTDTQNMTLLSWDISELPPGDSAPKLGQPPIQIGEVVTRIAVSPAADVFVVGTDKGAVRFYGMSPGTRGVKGGTFVEPNEPYGKGEDRLNGAVNILAFSQSYGRDSSGSPRGFLVLAGTSDQSAAVYRVSNANGRVQPVCLWSSSREEQPVNIISAAFGPDGSKLVTGSNDGVTYVWPTKVLSTEGLAQPLRLESSSSPISAVCFGGVNSRWLFTGSMDGTIRRWDLKNQKSVDVIRKELQSSKPDQLLDKVSAFLGGN